MFVQLCILAAIASSFMFNHVLGNFKNKILCIFYLSLMLPLIVLNTDNNDYQAYVDIFNNSAGYAEPGYALFVDAFKAIGFRDYSIVLIVLFALVAYTFYSLTRFSKNLSIFIIFYVMLLFPLDVTQIRFTFCSFILLNSVVTLSKRQYFLSAALAVAAVSFHYFGLIIVFAVLLGWLFMRQGNLKYLLSIFWGLVFFIVLPSILSLPMVSSLRTFTEYLSEGKLMSVLSWGGVLFLYLFVVQLGRNPKFSLPLHEISTRCEDPSLRLSSLIFNTLIASFVFLSGLYYLYEFNRLYRFTMLLTLVHSGIVYSGLRPSGRALLLAFYVVVWSGLGLYYSSVLDYDRMMFGFQKF